MARGEGLHGGLLEDTCGRRRRRDSRNRLSRHVRAMRPLVNRKRSSEGGLGKTLIVHTITDKIIRAISIIHSLFA